MNALILVVIFSLCGAILGDKGEIGGNGSSKSLLGDHTHNHDHDHGSSGSHDHGSSGSHDHGSSESHDHGSSESHDHGSSESHGDHGSSEDLADLFKDGLKSSYDSPPSTPSLYYGRPGLRNCTNEVCKGSVIITKPSFESHVKEHKVFDITEGETEHTQTSITLHSSQITKEICTATALTTVYGVEFRSELSQHVVTECSPRLHTKTITKFIPISTSITINQCVGTSEQVHKLQSVELKQQVSQITSVSVMSSTTVFTNIIPSTKLDAFPVCTETQVCEGGHIYPPRTYY